MFNRNCICDKLLITSVLLVYSYKNISTKPMIKEKVCHNHCDFKKYYRRGYHCDKKCTP